MGVHNTEEVVSTGDCNNPPSLPRNLGKHLHAEVLCLISSTSQHDAQFGYPTASAGLPIQSTQSTPIRYARVV